MIPSVRLGAHEIENLTNEHYRKAKIKRLNQVRDQASQFARNLRKNREDVRNKEICKMEQDLSVKAKNEIEKIIQEMEDDALSCLTNFGAAHSKADLENQMPNSYQAAAEKNKKRALLRGKEALKDLQLQRQQENFDRNKKIITRKNALDTEAVRSSYIVSLPPVKFVEPKKKEEVHPKVMLFDKGSLYQTEYELKENIVEKITSPKDARVAAEHFEIENNLLSQEKQKQREKENAQILRRGKVALTKEKSHNNYLRLLAELDKIEANKDKKWEIESTVSTLEKSSSNSVLSCDEADIIDEVSVRDVSQQEPLPKTHLSVDEKDTDQIPVQDIPFKIPTLNEGDGSKLNEIARLLNELKEEQNRWIASDKDKLAHATNSTPEQTPSTGPTTSATRTCPRSESPGSNTTSAPDIVLFSDDDVQIRLNTQISQSQRTKKPAENFSKRLKEVRKERQQLETALKASGSAPHPHESLGSCIEKSATSTPLSHREKKLFNAPNDRQATLKHYIQKLMQMKRQQIQQLSVSSSSSSGAIHPHPELSIPSSSDGTVYSCCESPASEKWTSKVSNTSSLPLGAEASVFTDQKIPDSGELFSLAPVLAVYNDIYQAFHRQEQRLVDNRQEVKRVTGSFGGRAGRTPDALTESSFMSLTLSTSSASTPLTKSSMIKPTVFPPAKEVEGACSPLSVGSVASVSLTLSSSSTSTTSGWRKGPSAPSLMNEMKCTKSLAASTTQSSCSSHSNASKTSSQDVSMPDVDEALRRLGLPSMQSVLRR